MLLMRAIALHRHLLYATAEGSHLCYAHNAWHLAAAVVEQRRVTKPHAALSCVSEVAEAGCYYMNNVTRVGTHPRHFVDCALPKSRHLHFATNSAAGSHLCYAHNAGHLAAAVVEEGQVAKPHAAHVVARLRVADPYSRQGQPGDQIIISDHADCVVM
jgi:hypothetical protein